MRAMGSWSVPCPGPQRYPLKPWLLAGHQMVTLLPGSYAFPLLVSLAAMRSPLAWPRPHSLEISVCLRPGVPGAEATSSQGPLHCPEWGSEGAVRMFADCTTI